VNKTLNNGFATPADAGEMWASAQQRLRTMLSPDIYNLWFAPLKVHLLEGDTLTLEVANDFCGVWLQDNYLDVLQRVTAQVSGQPLKVMFRVLGGGTAAKSHAESENHKPRRKEEAAEPGSGREVVFNPRNTFDNFVVGANNTFAHAAATAVAQSPGKSYNPLFVYSGVGLGKTHLLHAIGQFVVHHKKGLRVTYVSCEKFTNEFIDAIQNNQLMRFRRKYRLTDVFLIDDVQFLAGKERIQEEFFHTFNTLHEAHKQIVLTSDRPPGEIANLEQRLVSRFEWGLTTDIQAPDVETRLAILRQKASLMAMELPEDILNFLAQRIRTNIRRLEGALVRVTSYQSLVGKKLTVEVAENLLREILHEEGRHTITIEMIQRRVAEYFDIRLADMSGKRRPEHIAFPRQIAMYLARTLTESSLNTIGEAFGGRDHGTVLHACRQVKDRMQVEPTVRQKVHHLEKLLLR
jgi:chromosomal replication initiator protein